MDLTTPTKSPHSQNDTPPHLQPINETLKNHHHPQLHQPPPPPPPPKVITYKECLKNHAASIGGHAVDGCGEFMPSSTAPLKCDACGCHRNFHRRDPDDCYSSPTPITTKTTHFLDFQRHPLPHQSRILFSPSPSPPPSLQKPPPSFSGDHHRLPSPVTPTTGKGENSGRKRFRTRFTQNQKEKMIRFAEKMDWKMPKSDESDGVEEFCNEVGVSRGVLKVWMHNNKQTIGKKYSNKNNNLDMNNIASENVGIITFQNNNVYDVDKINGPSPSSS